MSKRRKIVVFIDAGARSVEKELADEAYTWEEYPDARLQAADKLCEAGRKTSVALRKVKLTDAADTIDKAIARYEGEK